MHRLVAVAMVLALLGCQPGSPVAIEDPPLSERLEQRRNRAVESIARQVAEAPDDEVSELEETEAADFDPPGSLALSGDVPLDVSEPLVVEIVGQPLGLKLRNGPGPGYGAEIVIPSDALLTTTTNVTGEWIQVRFGEHEGWVPIRVLRPTQTETGDTIPAISVPVDNAGVVYVVAGADVGVNIRAAPDALSNLVNGAPVGSRVVGTGRTEGDWIEVEFADDTGWAFGGYLTPTTGPPDDTAENDADDD